MKSEPQEFSIHDLQRKGKALWDGVRNYQARNMLRDEMRVGDRALFYHSNAGSETGVVGEMTIANAAYPDPTQFQIHHKYFDPKSSPENPRWVAVDVAFEKVFPRLIPLSLLKQKKRLAAMPLLKRGNRLSIMKLTKTEYDYISTLANSV